ncbi:PREDICTED: uncharacterized protein LOC103331632 [Prunus mume]|uniref:Uncharacterized protein LOC103331632 n=1 Tax=Prunus mume TaxID=102107 RepID=A0ABM0P080_PRUMU|nr:PREDICTED: uncharacterized protein LOC103331632 [Prunus mume]
MEEGSPGVLPKHLRHFKRSRIVNDGDLECAMEDDGVPSSIFDSRLQSKSNLKVGTESFRDKLMNKVNLIKNVGIDVNSLDAEYAELNDKDDVVLSRGDRGPSIQFSERAMNRLCKPWQNALIIKLVGRLHTYNYLHDRLQQKWSLNGGWKLVDLVNEYFVVTFEVEEDLNYVLTEGPWIIARQYLTMQKWRSGFCPSTASITRMAVWIRVSAIQLECFDVWALKRIGNLLGKLLKIDAHTTSQNRGKFARLCVELDLTKPLEAFVQINQVWYNIEYEGLPEICYNCGLYGHKRENCLLNANSNPDKARSSQDDEVSGDDAAMSKEDNFINKEGLRGPWMNVPPRRRPKVSGNGDNGQGLEIGTKDLVLLLSERQPPLGQVFDSLIGPKVWTKSKGHKAINKSALKDISNQSRVMAPPSMKKNQAVIRPSKEVSSVLSSKGKFAFSVKQGGNSSSVNEHMASWESGQHLQKDKNVYIFGHQPPSIIDPCDEAEGSDSGVDEDSMALSVTEEECPITTMDLSEGQVSDPNEKLVNNVFAPKGGMAVDF